MKKIFIILLYNLLVITAIAQQETYLDASSCPFKLGEPQPITTQTDFNHPMISPDGTKVIVTKKGYDGIYLIDLSKGNNIQTISKESFAGFNMQWSKDGNIRFTKNVKQSGGKGYKQYLTYDLNSKSTSSDNYYKTKSGEVELHAINNVIDRIVQVSDGKKTWDIVKDKGVYYDVLMSPDFSKVLVHKNDGRMYIYATDGSGIISCVGHGLCHSWSTDGQYLLYFISEDDGYTTQKSELYISSINGKNKWKITDTSDKIELWPHWSADGNAIVYKDFKSGLIYKSSIIKNDL